MEHSSKKGKSFANRLNTCCSIKPVFLFLFLPFCPLFAQEDFSAFYEPEVSLNIGTESRWSYNFGVANREAVYENEDFLFRAEHIELSHFTNYEVGFYGKLSLGVKYRFSEIFEDTDHDELRITQQYGHAKKFNALKIAHRVRLEQRIREATTYRTRYRFSVGIPLGGEVVDPKEFALVVETEALLSIEKNAAPEIDQRFGVSLENEIFKNTEFSFGLEYQYEDYFHDPQTELFLITEISVSL